MTRRNVTLIIIIVAMVLIILNFNYSDFNIESKKTWLLLGASSLIIASIISMFTPNNKKAK